ncbi:MAG: PIG-L family deacetylase [Solirubrobacterales bacterium]|nr:PIG-L family deacetylase [Solirubrobacterales bacterium]
MSAPAAALVVAAHADDCEFGCGATVAGWADAGAALTLIVVTDGSMGSHDPELSDAALRDRREVEARAGARVLGIGELRFLRRRDGELTEDPELVRELAAAIRELRPEVVITHDPWRLYDLHPDHAIVGRLVVGALFAAREPRAARELAARGLDPWRPRELLLFGAEEPDRLVAVADTVERKLAALLCHESQFQTSFAIEAPGDRERFAAAVRERALRADPDGGGPCEAFRCLALPGW